MIAAAYAHERKHGRGSLPAGIAKMVAELQEELKELVERVPEWRKAARDKIKELNRKTAAYAVGHSFAQIRRRYADLPGVMEYLGAVEEEVNTVAATMTHMSRPPNTNLRPWLAINAVDGMTGG